MEQQPLFLKTISPTKTRLDVFTEKATQALKGLDADTVHRTRIATRRLRVALAYVRPFYPEPEIRRLRMVLRQVNRWLGDIRTLDVNRKLLQEEKTRSGRLLHHREMIEVIEKALERDRKDALSRRPPLFSAEGLERIEHEIKLLLAAPDVSATTEDLQAAGADLLMDLQQATRKRWKRYSRKESKKALHGLRIAVKQLRYALEIYDEHHGLGDRESLRRLVKLQDRLGGVHDLEAFLAWVKRSRSLQIVALRSRRIRDERGDLLKEWGRITHKKEEKLLESLCRKGRKPWKFI